MVSHRGKWQRGCAVCMAHCNIMASITVVSGRTNPAPPGGWVGSVRLFLAKGGSLPVIDLV